MDRGNWWANVRLKTGNQLSSWRYGASSSSKSISRGYITLMNWSSVWNWPDHHWILTSGMGVFGHMCGQKTNTSSNYCGRIQPHDNRCFSFCQKWHDFLKIFFCKLPQIRTYKFRTVLRQHTEGVVYHHSIMESIIRVLLEISSSLKKSVKNWQSYRHEYTTFLRDTV